MESSETVSLEVLSLLLCQTKNNNKKNSYQENPGSFLGLIYDI